MLADKDLSSELFEWNNKYLTDLSLNELSDLQYILENLPLNITYENIKEGDNEFETIDDYIEYRIDKFFDVGIDDYKRLIGTCYMCEDKSEVVKIVGIRDDFDDPYYKSDNHVDQFLYEKYVMYKDGSWHNQHYNWLQETAYGKYADEKYRKWCLTKQTNMNICSESMFHLGVDGNLYVDVSCGGDYEKYEKMSEATFEIIRNEAIKNDGNYTVRN